MNKIEINFTPCEPAPPSGYNVKWWVAGSDAVPKNAGNFFMSPAVFYDTLNPAGTQYEGFIKSVCGGVSTPVYWDTASGCGAESGGEMVINGTIVNSAHGVFVDIDQSILCDVTFSIDGIVDDGGLHGFGTNVTILAGATHGANTTAVPSGVIDCIKPTTAGQTTFVYQTLCLGITYTFILEIDIPC